jgi:eukaryotic-like serine/threonine-protein kinase
MIGEEIGGYTILENLGTGTMGTVYKAEDLATHRVVAVKVVRSQVLYDREKRERFLQGLLSAAELKHDKICPILEIGDEDDDFYVAMPFLKGTTLKQQIERKRLNWEQALEIALAIGEALAVGHAGGAVHRGLKPANVWLRNDGTVLVTDFNMARFTEIDRQTGSKVKSDFADTVIPMAALAYMSPEQIRGDPVDYRTDIFSFGVVLYEMLSGHHPFESRNSLSRMSAILDEKPSLVSARGRPVPAELDPILDKVLAKSPQNRYQRIDDLLPELRRIREQSSVPAARQSDSPRNSEEEPPTYAAYVLLAAVLILLALVAYLLL